MKLYKYTDEKNKTGPSYSDHKLLWGNGVTHTTKGRLPILCNSEWIHVFEHPLQAALLKNYYAGNYSKFWECEGEVDLRQGHKAGCRKLTTVKELPPPILSGEDINQIYMRVRKQFGHWPDIDEAVKEMNKPFIPNASTEQRDIIILLTQDKPHELFPILEEVYGIERMIQNGYKEPV